MISGISTAGPCAAGALPAQSGRRCPWCSWAAQKDPRGIVEQVAKLADKCRLFFIEQTTNYASGEPIRPMSEARSALVAKTKLFRGESSEAREGTQSPTSKGAVARSFTCDGGLCVSRSVVTRDNRSVRFAPALRGWSL